MRVVRNVVPLSALTATDCDIHGLLWSRCRVTRPEGGWITEWKWVIGTWVRWLGDRVNDAPSDPRSWYIQTYQNRDGFTIDQIEITRFCHLPPPIEEDGVMPDETTAELMLAELRTIKPRRWKYHGYPTEEDALVSIPFRHLRMLLGEGGW